MARPAPELLTAVAAATAVVLAAPFIGDARAAIQSAMPGQFRIVIGSIVAGGVALATLAAVARIREHRAARYAALGAALAGGLVYARLSATGNPDVDAVERFHFVEYGALTLLFYRVWRDREDLRVLGGPLLAAMFTAIVDEWVQWFVPNRVGEMHDVLLNAAAVACGLVFGLGIAPPAALSVRLAPGTARASAIFAAGVILACAVFFHMVHLGYEIHDGANTFRSRYTAPELDAASRDRMARSSGQPRADAGRFSREDHYLSEGLWHVQHRNEASAANDTFRAWRENLILERFFVPALDWPGAGANRWPPAQRANTAAEAGANLSPYVSDAAPYPIYTWSRAAFWAAIAAIVAAASMCCRLLARRGAVGEAAL